MRPARRASALYVAGWVAIGLVIGFLVRPVADRLESSPPRVGWGAAATLLVVALVVGSLAWNTWQSLHKKHERMTSDHAAKMLALSRSCVIVGALFAGGYGGFALAFVGDLDTQFGQERAVNGGVAALAGLAAARRRPVARAGLSPPRGRRRRDRRRGHPRLTF